MKHSVRIATRLDIVDVNGHDSICGDFIGVSLCDDTRIQIRFEEEENGGPTQLMATPDGAVLRRNGNVRSRLAFLTGHRTDCQYQTPEGRLPMEILTRSYSLDITAYDGRLEAEYTLLLDGEQVSENKLCLKWRFMGSL